VKFLDRRRGAVDAFTQGELLNHRRLHCAHVARLKEVRGFTVWATLLDSSAWDRSCVMWHAAALLLPFEEAAVVLPCTCMLALMIRALKIHCCCEVADVHRACDDASVTLVVTEHTHCPGLATCMLAVPHSVPLETSASHGAPDA
jgi:hypothetical protein